MRTPGIAGISDIECPSCGHTLHDFDPVESVHGLERLHARCHQCMTEQWLEIDHWRDETWVRSAGHAKWASPAA